MIYYNKKINPIERHYDKITEEIATVFIKSIFTEDYETKKYINLLPGIKKVIYLSDKYKDQTSTIASKKLLDLAGVKYEKYEGRVIDINVN